MIISRTPLRMSFVGGGTDLKEFYGQDYGQVLCTSIDKFLYVMAKRQLAIVEYKYRVGWSQTEFKNSIDAIENPIVREALRLLEIDFPVEISTFADVPASTGLGSSSAFAVGVLHALFALKGQMVTKSQLANLATRIEIDVLKRAIGKQDHFGAAYGNLNIFTFLPNDAVTVDPVFYDVNYVNRIQDSLLLVYTAIKRDASEVLKEQRDSTATKLETLRKMRDQVPRLAKVISEGRNPDEFGEILHEGWELKKSLSQGVSSPFIDELYEKARKSGALGGKLLGAGGGGFLLFYVRPQDKARLCEAMKDHYQMPFRFDTGGTRITYYDHQSV